jgi:hypothetical protein
MQTALQFDKFDADHAFRTMDKARTSAQPTVMLAWPHSLMLWLMSCTLVSLISFASVCALFLCAGTAQAQPSAQPFTVQGLVQIRQPSGLTIGFANTRITAFIRTGTETDTTSVLTNANGQYSLTLTSPALSAALTTGSVSLRATRDGYTFAPDTLNITPSLALATPGTPVTVPTFEAVTYSVGGTLTFNFLADSLRNLTNATPLVLSFQLTTGATVVAATAITFGSPSSPTPANPLLQTSYTFSNIPPGSYIVKASTALPDGSINGSTGGATSDTAVTFSPQRLPVRVIDKSIQNLNIVATPVLPTIAGRVLFNGALLRNATVRATRQSSSTITFSGQTDANGVFSLPVRFNDTYTVALVQDGYSSNTPSVRVQWPLTSSPVAVTLSATQRVGTITGFIRYRDTLNVGSIPTPPTVTLKADSSNIFPDVMATTTTESATEGGFGGYRYTFPSVPQGTYAVTPSSPSLVFVPTAVSVNLRTESARAPDMTSFLALRPVRGRILLRDSSGARVLAGITVNIQSSSNLLNRNAVSGADGSFNFAVPTGRYRILVFGNDTYFTIGSNLRDIVVDGSSADIDLNDFFMGKYPRNAYLATGDVRLPDGTPLAGVQIRAVQAAAQATTEAVSSTATTRVDGGFTLNITSATYTITPSLAGYVFTPSSRVVSIEESSRSIPSFSATLAPITITGSTKTIGGTTIPVRQLKASIVTSVVAPRILREESFDTDNIGTYSITLTGVLPGQRILLTPQDTTLQYGPVQRVLVASASEAVVRDTLRIGEQDFRVLSPRAGIPLGAITGRITPPVAGVLISDGTRSALSDSAGRYTLRNVPNGSYTLTAFQTGRRFQQATSAVTVVVSPREVRGTTDFQALPAANTNRPPVALRIPGNPAGRLTLQAGRPQSFRPQTLFADPDSTQLVLSAFVDDPTVVRVRITNDNVSIDPLWTGDPNPDIAPTATVTLLASDNQGGVTVITFRVVVSPPNSVPTTLVRSTTGGKYLNTNHNAAIVISRNALSTLLLARAAKPNETPSLATPVGRDDEFAAFNANDECVGSLVLSGEEDVLTVWSNEPESGIVGMQQGNKLRYEVIQAGDRRRKRITVGYLLGDPPPWPINDAIITKTTITTSPDGSLSGGVSQTVGVHDEANAVTGFITAPNPTFGELAVEYSLAASGAVRCELLNAFGQHTLTLMDGTQAAGRYRIRAATDELPSGLYLCRLQVGASVVTSKVIIVR